MTQENISWAQEQKLVTCCWGYEFDELACLIFYYLNIYSTSLFSLVCLSLSLFFQGIHISVAMFLTLKRLFLQ